MTKKAPMHLNFEFTVTPKETNEDGKTKESPIHMNLDFKIDDNGSPLVA